MVTRADRHFPFNVIKFPNFPNHYDDETCKEGDGEREEEKRVQ